MGLEEGMAAVQSQLRMCFSLLSRGHYTRSLVHVHTTEPAWRALIYIASLFCIPTHANSSDVHLRTLMAIAALVTESFHGR